jgi:ribonuclease HI
LGLGAIVRNWKGEVLAAQNLTIMENLKPVAAEALGAHHATQLCRDLGFRPLIMKGDAHQVINAIKSNSNNWRRYSQLINDTVTNYAPVI